MQIIELNDLRAGDNLFQELYLVINPDFKRKILNNGIFFWIT